MDQSSEALGLGWLPDYPDFRDYTAEQESVSARLKSLGQTKSIHAMLATTGVVRRARPRIPAAVDLRAWCSPVENQGSLGSCTANAGVGVVEYFERRAFGNHIDGSWPFLCKTSRRSLHWSGDTGAFLCNAMGALVLFGVPPE